MWGAEKGDGSMGSVVGENPLGEGKTFKWTALVKKREVAHPGGYDQSSTWGTSGGKTLKGKMQKLYGPEKESQGKEEERIFCGGGGGGGGVGGAPGEHLSEGDNGDSLGQKKELQGKKNVPFK